MTLVLTATGVDKRILLRQQSASVELVRPSCTFTPVATVSDRDRCLASKIACLTPHAYCAEDAGACRYIRIDRGPLEGRCNKER